MVQGPHVEEGIFRLPFLQHRVSTPLLAFLCFIFASMGYNPAITNVPLSLPTSAPQTESLALSDTMTLPEIKIMGTRQRCHGWRVTHVTPNTIPETRGQKALLVWVIHIGEQ